MHPSRFAPARASSSVPATGPLYLRKSRGYRAAARPRTAWGPGRLRCVGGRGRDRARGAASIARASRFSLHSRPGRRRRRAPAGGVCRLRRARGGRGGARVGAPSYTLQRDGQFYFNACLLCAHNHTADGAHGHTEPPGANYIYPTARRPTAWGLANDGGTVVGAGFASPRRSRASRSE